jgi:glycosyltransferase involved in cell wall biosynthesis
MRIAAFGFRSLPSTKGSAGADKFVEELLPRLVERGHQVLAYNRKYKDAYIPINEYKGVKIKSFSTINKKGFDTLCHSFKCTADIIINNTADIVHIQNGGNSIWALPLRLFKKKVFVSQDGVDWKRGKWPWYGKIYLKISAFISSKIPNTIIFDNVPARSFFEKRFHKKFAFIPFGSEVPSVENNNDILTKFSLGRGEYYLFVGRAKTNKKLVLVGGSPNPSPYEAALHSMSDSNVIFTGFVYGDDVTRLMLNSYCYIQPSDVEGLSPVVLSVMGLGVPLIVSNIEENVYAVQDTALKFDKADISSLTQKIIFAEENYSTIKELSKKAQDRALSEFNWDKVTEDHIKLFKNT